MAIYSLNYSSVGKAKHAAGTAGAHLRYITRPGAEAYVESSGMPSGRASAKRWMDEQERISRQNESMIGKFMVALPKELSGEEQNVLVRNYIEELTENKCPWFFAIHREGKDSNNPHAHIVIRDRDASGKRVLDMSASKKDRQKKGMPIDAMEHIRTVWETSANKALQVSGHNARIDRRSLKAQDIDRMPQIHVGPNAQHIDHNVQSPVSKPKEVANDVRVSKPSRIINYPEIDKGLSRSQYNAQIRGANALNHARQRFVTKRYRELRKDLWSMYRAELTDNTTTHKQSLREQIEAIEEQKRQGLLEIKRKEALDSDNLLLRRANLARYFRSTIRGVNIRENPLAAMFFASSEERVSNENTPNHGLELRRLEQHYKQQVEAVKTQTAAHYLQKREAIKQRRSVERSMLEKRYVAASSVRKRSGLPEVEHHQLAA